MNKTEAGKFITTLEEVMELLGDSLDNTHIERLGRIQEWLANGTNYEIEAFPQPRDESTKLDLEEIDSKTFSALTIYGKAIIFEEGHTVHQAWIEHESGATYKSLEKFVDFLDAEFWIQEALNQLSNTRIVETNLDCIHFTLDICKRLLLQKNDLPNSAKLQDLEILLDEILL